MLQGIIILLLNAKLCVSSVVSDSLHPHRLEPVRILSPWDFPGKNTSQTKEWVAISYSRVSSQPRN